MELRALNISRGCAGVFVVLGIATMFGWPPIWAFLFGLATVSMNLGAVFGGDVRLHPNC